MTRQTAQHTPGPWYVSDDGKVYSHDGEPIAVVSSGSITRGPLPSAVFRANARLIAAAPDLLATLKDLIDYANAYSDSLRHSGFGSSELGSNSPAHSIAGDARAAIARAEGRTP